ncbi:hypothetical protein P4233_26725 [Pseudomonas aeruginosa]|nr:hypothetical protein [Pseudomonas aeruginosa]
MLAVRDAFQGEVGAPEAADQAVGDGLVGAALQAGELMQAEAWAAGQVVAPAQQAGQPSGASRRTRKARTSGSSKREQVFHRVEYRCGRRVDQPLVVFAELPMRQVETVEIHRWVLPGVAFSVSRRPERNPGDRTD